MKIKAEVIAYRSWVWLVLTATAIGAERLPGTDELTWQGDVAARMVEQVDAFLLRELERSIEQRGRHWQRDVTSPDAYQRSIAPQRDRLAHILGVRDPRAPSTTPQLLARFDLPAGTTSAEPLQSRVGRSSKFDVYAIRWPTIGQVEGTGLLLVPRDSQPVANVVALPDCEVTPEQLIGLLPGVPAESQYARRLAESGCRVVVPLLVNRQRGQFDWGPRPAPSITNREMLYRSAFELGRGLIGYEIQQLMAVVDWFERDGDVPIGVLGWGEGGLLALYAGALDPRIDCLGVSGYFDSRQSIWREPIDRNVFGLLEQFGDAELASLIAPRRLVIEAARGPTAELPGDGGAPARLASPDLAAVRAEVARARGLTAGLADQSMLELVESGNGDGPPGSAAWLTRFLLSLNTDAKLRDSENPPCTSGRPPTWPLATAR